VAVLHDFLAANRDEIIALARSKVAARWAPQATTLELQDGVPLFLEQLIEALEMSAADHPAMVTSAAKHGGELLKLGFSVAQVVRDYGDLCQAVTELADFRGAAVTVDEFRRFNSFLDDAIAEAVTEYTRLREHSITDRESERLGSLAHELRNCLSAASLSFEILQSGKVAIGGNTGSVLGRSLRRMRELLARTMAAVRIDAGLLTRQRVSLRRFVEDIELEATMEATSRGLHLTVTAISGDVAMELDEPLLAAAVTNVLHNALKFTRPGGHVWLRTLVSAERVVFEIEDECGGLPPGAAEGMFLPFQQHGVDRTGMGLGLAISRKGIEANAGKIHVCDLPGQGCVFTIDVPRCPPTPSPPGPWPRRPREPRGAGGC
jgi:signal transduction histidine kinase